MIMFLIISILMVVAIVFVFYPFVVKMPDVQIDEHLAQNVQAHEQRLKQIQMQLDGGLLDEKEADSQRTQSARQLLKDEAQSKRVNTEIKSYMNVPVVMSVVLICVSIFLYMQKGYQLDLKVAQLQTEYDAYPSKEALDNLLATKAKLIESNPGVSAIQIHELGLQQMQEGLFVEAKHSFEKAFQTYVSHPDYVNDEAAYLKARIAHAALMLNQYKPTNEVNELLAESLAYAQSNLASQLNQFIDAYKKVHNNSEMVFGLDVMRLGALLYEFGEYQLAKPYILQAANLTQEEGTNPPLAARAFAIAAQITVNLNGNLFDKEVMGYLNSAVQNDPSDYLVLQLTGEFAYNEKQYDMVYQTWSILFNDPNYAQSISSDMFDKYQITLEKLGVENDVKGLIKVTVDIDESLKALSQTGQYLFVLARPVGGRMPLAVKKIPMSEVSFPLTITLSDRDAMTPQMTLSSQDAFEIVARVSLSGIANAASGEPESEVLNVDNGTADVSVIINSLHP
ncbi:c-type cytochrome biogenesis protein CcmI [Marinicellulosiphila megalodicopiae]|uniref:c-type cytochrome biogenesis protein CcmI n=1 Tax=Marinicellulosiphila megalodicopiae TaxID=2724896 RepID=UPI003BAF9367